MVLEGRKVLGGFQPSTPTLGTGCVKGVQEVSGASAVHFGKNLKKTKLQGAPDLVSVGHLFGPKIRIQKDLGPMSFWSHGHSLLRGIYNTKAVGISP